MCIRDRLQIAYNDDSVMIEGIIGLSSDDAEQKLKKAGFTTKIITSYQMCIRDRI